MKSIRLALTTMFWLMRRGADARRCLPLAHTASATVPRAFLVGLTVLAVTTLSAFAYASPPDPSWIKGIYDDDDYDDVVVLATSATGHQAPVVLALLPVPPLVHVLAETAEPLVSAQSTSSAHPRAPPAS